MAFLNADVFHNSRKSTVEILANLPDSTLAPMFGKLPSRPTK
ncbi:MAG: hypothetical protein PUC21_09810 [Bacteroidales bacterium]|nr:hypothetical protein [Bacteroidales bacterium]MDD6851070.1 hypothetical protein [Bacteroidales bacterium]